MTTVCATKQRFERRVDAMRLAKRMSERKSRTRRRAEAYRCSECGGWHVFTTHGLSRSVKRKVA